MFFDEHMHEDEEIRYILDSNRHFDIRHPKVQTDSDRDRYGDVQILPAKVYHGFTVDESDAKVASGEGRASSFRRCPGSDAEEGHCRVDDANIDFIDVDIFRLCTCSKTSQSGLRSAAEMETGVDPFRKANVEVRRKGFRA